MTVTAISKSGDQKREDIPSPKGWDEKYGPRSNITHLNLFNLLEKKHAPVTQFLKWLEKNADFSMYVSRMKVTNYDIATKERLITQEIHDLWTAWFSKATFLGGADLKDTLQFMADVGFFITWDKDEMDLLVSISILNKMRGRGRGAKGSSKGDLMQYSRNAKHKYSVIPGLQYGQTNNFQKNFNQRLLYAKREGTSQNKTRQMFDSNMSIDISGVYDRVVLDRELYYYEKYNSMWGDYADKRKDIRKSMKKFDYEVTEFIDDDEGHF